MEIKTSQVTLLHVCSVKFFCILLKLDKGLFFLNELIQILFDSLRH